jgi:hypothetical protein
MNAEDKKPDELTEAYRHASAKDAGRPDDATRRAILAEAEAAARRRRPANDARYVVRAVAGIAVIGVAIVLWRQMDQPAVTAKDVAPEAQRADAVADTAAAGAATGQLERAESLARVQSDDSDAALLTRYFPQQYNSDMPHSVWLVRDAAGRLLRSGELAAGQRLEDLTPQIELQLGGRKLGVWREQTLINAQGQPVRLLTTSLP